MISEASALSAMDRFLGENPLPELLAQVLKTRCAEAAEHLVGARVVTLRVHPEDVALARHVIGDRTGWTITGDPAIRGGCVATSEGGALHGDLDSSIQALKAAAEAWRAEAAGKNVG